jgi:hypothetical protein
MSMWIRSWWVVLFLLSISAIHFHFFKVQNRGINALQTRLMQMEKDKIIALKLQSDLKEHLASQNDPAWIELVLMRNLGVVPEGFMKVHFK